MEKKIENIATGEMYAGYASDHAIREHASSGGIVSAVLGGLLDDGGAEGALVSRITSGGGEIRAVTSLVTSMEEVLRHAGSSYIDTPVLAAAARLAGFEGRAAVVCLPCQARALKKLLALRPELGEKISLVISLFCRGAVSWRFYRDLFTKLGIDRSGVESVKVKRGHARGKVTVRGADGISKTIPFGSMNAYRIAGAHSLKRCLWCTEHLGREADIAVGDIFTPEYKRRGIKHSAVVCWTREGAEVLGALSRKGSIQLEYFGMERYRRSFRAIEDFGSGTASRKFAAFVTGQKVKKAPAGLTVSAARRGGQNGRGIGDRDQHASSPAASYDQKAASFNPFHALAWTVVFTNARLSRTRGGRRFLFALPRWVMMAEALIVKALSRIRSG